MAAGRRPPARTVRSPNALRALLLVATAAAAVAQWGCAAGTWYTSEADRPPTVPEDDTWMPANRGFGFAGCDLDVLVQAENHVTSSVWFLFIPVYLRGPHPSYRRLPIWVEVAPHHPPQRFDPGQVAVVGTRGDTLHPVEWWGPGIGRVGGLARGPGRLPHGHGPVSLAEREYFLLEFDGRRAGYDFTVLPSAGAGSGECREIPAMKFRRRLYGWFEGIR